MPRGLRQLQLSFAGGEMSPEMYARYDDVRQRAGAARLRNMIVHPRGSAARRPGFQFVRPVKSSAHAVRLLPFRFSTDQTHAIEMGRASIDGRDIGYFRFHTEGATLLQPKPREWVPPPLASAINSGTDEWTVGAHSFQTGDPIIFTMEATTETVTFTPGTKIVNNTAHAFQVNAQVMFRTSGTLPPELEPGRLYYLVNAAPGSPADPDDFTISKRPGGKEIIFSSAGTGTHKVACLPRGSGEFLLCNTTYYAVNRSATTIAIAKTRADALADIVFDFLAGFIGTVDHSDVRVHYDYRNGSVVFYTTETSPFYCRKTTWGNPGSAFIYAADHADHGPTHLVYWVRQSGSSSTVTFDLGTDRVNWTTHGLANGDPVTFTTTSTLPTGIVAGTPYYVRNKTTNDFQLAASVPGPIIDLGGAPAGIHTAFANGFYEVPHYYAESALFEVNLVQSGDVMTLVHVDAAVRELKRLGATNWLLGRVLFNATVPAPSAVDVGVYGGEGLTVTAVTAASPAVLTINQTHNYVAGVDVVWIQDVGDIPNGTYIVHTTPTGTTLTLRDFESGVVVASGSATLGATPRIRPSSFEQDGEETYVVTTLDENDEESRASDQAIASNNLLVSGAYNTISWDPVGGAKRYRVYKDLNGLFGYIGEVDAPATSFVDDNIEPDLSITPPILDDSLRRQAFVTFDPTADVVNWPSHGLEEGAPVEFETNSLLPVNVVYGTTYYVLNPSEDDFQIAAGPDDDIPIGFIGTGNGEHIGISGHFPGAVTYFEQRRVFGGARLRPQDFWMTASSTESDLSYSIPTVDSDRIHNRIAARERSQIRHAVPSGHLLLLTSASEYRVTSLDGAALTPGSISVRTPTHVGVSPVAGVLVNNTVLFPAARGGHLREMGFLDQVADYVTGDVSLRAAHLFDDRTIAQMAYHQAPHPIVWTVSSDGTLLGFTYIPEEQVAGWHTHDISNGTIESCATVAEGDEDRVYVITNRSGTRYVERMGAQAVDAIEDLFFVDWGISYDGPTVSSLFLPHLANQAVVYLANGFVGSGTVDATGTLTLAAAASKVQVGLAYQHELRTLPLGMQVDAAFGTGRTKNINQVWLRVYKSGPFDVGPDPTALSSSPGPDPGQLLTQLVEVTTLGQWGDEGQVYVMGSTPLPVNVVGLTLEVATGG